MKLKLLLLKNEFKLFAWKTVGKTACRGCKLLPTITIYAILKTNVNKTMEVFHVNK